jgi:hypothetical protein
MILKPSNPHVHIIKIEIESEILQPEGTQNIRDLSRYHLSPKKKKKSESIELFYDSSQIGIL